MGRVTPLLTFILLTFLSLPTLSDTLRIAVAANFKPVLEALSPRFEQQTNSKVLISSASSGILYNQINYGAPFDLFLSADQERPERLEQEGLIVEGSRKPYAFGRLVLWNRTRNPVTLKDFDHFLTHYKGRLSIANPALAPYGLAAQQTLKKLNAWQLYQGRLIQGASIQQAWQFVASGNVDMGLVALAQVLNEPAATITKIPDDYYQPIQQEMVILKRSNVKLAQKFETFLLNDSSQLFIKQQGYIRVN